METPKEFIKRFIKFSIGPMVNAFIGFISVPIVTRFLIPAEFGRASMYTTVEALFFIFIYLGMDYAMVREYNEHNDKKRLMSHVLFLPLLLATLLAAILNLWAGIFSWLLFDGEYVFLIRILSLSFFVNVFNRFSIDLIRMDEKAGTYSALLITARVLNFLLTLLYLVFIKRVFYAVILAGFLSTLSVAVIQLILTRKYWRLTFSFDWGYLKELIRIGLPIVPASILSWAFNSMDKIAIRTWGDFSDIGLYAGAFKIVSLMELLKRSFTTFWTPTSYRWYNNGVGVYRFRMVGEVLSLCLLIIYTVIVLARNIIIKLLASEYANSAQLLPFLLFIPILVILSETTVLGIHFSKKTIYHTLTSLWPCLLNIVGNFLLVPWWGALGAAITTGLSYGLFFFFRTYYSNKLWDGFSPHRIYVNVLGMFGIAFLTLLPFGGDWVVLTLFGILMIVNVPIFQEALSLKKEGKE